MWTDRAGLARWVEPQTGNEIAVHTYADTTPQPRSTFEQARLTRRPVVTPIVDLPGGGRGFVILVPVQHAGEFDGVIAGVVRADAFFSRLLRKDGSSSVEIREGDWVALVERAPEIAASTTFASTALPVGVGTRWTIRVIPGAALFDQERSLLPTAVLAAGVACRCCSLRPGSCSIRAGDAQRTCAGRTRSWRRRPHVWPSRRRRWNTRATRRSPAPGRRTEQAAHPAL